MKIKILIKNLKTGVLFPYSGLDTKPLKEYQKDKKTYKIIRE